MMETPNIALIIDFEKVAWKWMSTLTWVWFRSWHVIALAILNEILLICIMLQSNSVTGDKSYLLHINNYRIILVSIIIVN